ncbi:30S ribosomal protein S7 [Patescibacteria group bacterium]|nr:MAG: 30S ribosomal protein S7 [Patescibacteria group bacterium]
MSRKNRFRKIEIRPDPKYQNLLISKFVNRLMLGGKKSVAQKIIYSALDVIKEKAQKDPVEIFEGAIKRVSPVLEVKAKRIGGANYQIPYEVRGERREALACRWIIEAARSKKGKSMADKLALELMAASKGEGHAYKKKEDTHRMAEANKAFAHYARY